MSRKLKWEVTIAGADNGYIARVGCKLLVFESRDNLIREFTAYVEGRETAFAKELQIDCPTEAAAIPSRLTDTVARQ